jgi:hypothetical protein
MLDPFSGVGTSIAVGVKHGIAAVGVELSHLGVLAASVRLDPPDDRDDAIRVVQDMVKHPPAVARELTPELEWWIPTENRKMLGRFLTRIEGIRDVRTRLFVQLSVSAALRPASYWLKGSIKPQFDGTRTPGDLGDHVVRSARLIARDCDRETWPSDVRGRVIRASATHLPLSDCTFDIVLTSPPYFVTYDYVDVQRLSYLAFGWPSNKNSLIGRRYGITKDGTGFVPPSSMRRWYEEDFEGEKTTLGRALRAYLNDLEASLAEAYRVLVPGGVIVLAAADTTRRERAFRLGRAVSELLVSVGFEDVERRSRLADGRRILPARRDVSTGRFASSGQLGARECVVVGTRPE